MQKNVTISEANIPTEWEKESKLATLYMSSKFILEDDAPPPPEIIKNGILGTQNILIIGGKHKSRKSFLAFNLAIAISSGKGFSIFDIDEPHSVMVLSAEGGYYSNRDRVKKMMLNCANIVHENLHFYFDVNENLLTKDSFETLTEEIKKYKPEVIILDPLVRFHNADENSASEMSELFGKFRSLITEHNISIIIIHHQGKDENKGGSLRGSSVISGEYDSLIHISKGAKDKNKHTLHFDLRHSESPDNIDLFFNPDTYWFESKEKPNPIREIVKQQGEVNKSQLADLLVQGGHYKHKSTTYRYIDKAVVQEYIQFNPITQKYSLTA